MFMPVVSVHRLEWRCPVSILWYSDGVGYECAASAVADGVLGLDQCLFMGGVLRQPSTRCI